MRKDKLYLYTFFSITLIVVIFLTIAVNFFIKSSTDQIFELQIESSKRESKEISKLISTQLSYNVSKDDIVTNLQSIIQGTHIQTSFISILDWSGKHIAHPHKTKVGTILNSKDSSIFSINDEINTEILYKIFNDRNKNIFGENTRSTKKESEIIFLTPIENSDLIIAAHANIDKSISNIKSLKKEFYLIFGIVGAGIILMSFFVVRIIGSKYEKNLENLNKELEKELVSMSKLNSDLVAYQKKVKIKDEELDKDPVDIESGKKRILTHYRDELLTIPIETIAYIYVENTITYVICFDGKKSTTNSSLEELYASLDTSNFYRANRQVIVAIQAIKKIIKYGNNQLKIVIYPDSEINIIINKNKASEFKQWLNL